ncbi:CST complex subunit Ten1 [Biscogniauxia sp. FL1348]|nr:CST complex subunit Ten1 [Biscogniauxia sp. FL1348]
MSNGPLPSVRCLLSSLPNRQVGDKVRFLGCVTAYTTSSAHLSLEHNCPKGSAVKAVVDVNLLLQNLKTEQTDIGQWVHVIGYVTSIKHPPSKTTASNVRGRGATCITVQAIVLWTAQDLDIATYEQTLTAEAE